MAKMKPETKAQIREALRHPVTWWRGADLPEEKIRPWEGGIQFFAEALKGFMGGFTGMKGRLYEGLGEGKIPPNWLTINGLITTTWDGLNDPILGSYMDRKRYSANILRWIMRFNATFSPFFILIQCFNLGLTPLQRVVQWTLISLFADLMSTANAVGESKIWAGITPHSKQRGIVQLCKTLGNQMSQALSAIPALLMGLRDVLGISDYQIMIYGALIFAPLTIFCRWLPSYAKQRVDFNTVKEGEELPEPPTLRESFAVVKHNKWFVMETALKFVTVLTPATDGMFLYRFLLPKMRFRGKEIGGELIWSIKNFMVGNPGTFLQPFALQAIKKVGGELNMKRLNTAVALAATILKYIVGYKTFPRLMFMFAMEMLHDITNKWDPVAGSQINYQMLDYVEWRTGQRSEGMTMAVNGFLDKMIKKNTESAVNNAVKQWQGYLGYEFERELQPERFLKTVWPLMHIGPAIDCAVWLAGQLWFKYPQDPAIVEADLIERRTLARKMKEEAQLHD